MPFDPYIILRLLLRAEGTCECSRECHHHSGRCSTKLFPELWQPRQAQSVTSADDADGYEALCNECYQAVEEAEISRV